MTTMTLKLEERYKRLVSKTGTTTASNAHQPRLGTIITTQTAAIDVPEAVGEKMKAEHYQNYGTYAAFKMGFRLLFTGLGALVSTTSITFRHLYLGYSLFSIAFIAFVWFYFDELKVGLTYSRSSRAAARKAKGSSPASRPSFSPSGVTNLDSSFSRWC